MTVAERGPDLLRALLPRYHRVADARAGGLLDALLAVLGDSVDELRDEVAARYDDLFVETCEPWLVPHHAAQAGVTELTGDRAWVGLVTGLRRRKGTLGALVAAARAATGYPVTGEVGTDAVATTWSVAHPGLTGPGRAFARVSGRPAYPGATRLGEDAYPLPGVIRLSVWRLAGQPVSDRTAGAVAGRPRARTFHPFGVDQPLFEYADTGDPGRPAPRPLTRAALASALANGTPLPFAIAVGGRAVGPVAAADLATWEGRGRDVLVDPERGRLLLPSAPRGAVVVDHSYGTAAAIGGGPYPREHRHDLPRVNATGDLASALRQARTLGSCVVRIEDSATYVPDAGGWRLAVPAGARVRLAAAPGAAPALAGGLAIRLGAGAVAELSGLLVDGAVTVAGTGLLAVGDCTLLGTPALAATGREPVSVSVRDSIVGPVAATAPLRLGVRDSIVDGRGGAALGAPGQPLPSVLLDRVTVLGDTAAGVLVADHCLLAGAVVRDAGAGVLRHSAPAGPGDFTSTRYGDAAYGQVSDRADRALRAGGEDGGELGAFARGSATPRLDRLGAPLADFVPAGCALTVRLCT
jgi:hypothetical protein